MNTSTTFFVCDVLNELFFSLSHIQPTAPDTFVPITWYHKTQNDVRRYWVKVLGYNEVRNPDQNYQA